MLVAIKVSDTVSGTGKQKLSADQQCEVPLQRGQVQPVLGVPQAAEKADPLMTERSDGQ